MRSVFLSAFLFVLGLQAAHAQGTLFRQNYLPRVRYVLTQRDTSESRTILGMPVEMGGPKETVIRQVSLTESDLTAEVESDSIYVVTITLRRVRAWVEQNGEARTLDTDSSEMDTTDPFVLMNRALVGYPVRIRVGLDGRTREMLEIEALRERILASMPSELREMLGETIGETAPQLAQGYIDRTYTSYPGAQLAPGQTWTSTFKGAAPFPVETRVTYTLDQLEDGNAYVQYEGTMASPADAVPMGEGPFAMHLRVNGTLSGTWVEDLEDGTYTTITRSQTEGTGEPATVMPGMPTLTMRATTRTSGRTELRRAAP
ncbi:MAG TPA: DUF6263 family protein [Rhodothermales bacterium]|nr:DUF6263 family protein [Rhodothermales bacterium]